MVVDKTLYNILGVEPNASHENILKAIKKKSLEHHPDRGGSHEKMQEVNAAKTILTDPELRENYDRYGFDGVQSGTSRSNEQFGGLPQGLVDLFNFLSRGATSRQEGSRSAKGTDIKLVLKISLEELYLGTTKKIEVIRQIICIHCRGTGHRDKIDRQCHKCRGKGIEIIINQNGEIIQHIQRQCLACNGDGSIVDLKNRCESCHGQKWMQQKKMLDVYIAPGSKNGEKIELSNQGNESLNGESGSVWIILEQEAHSIFNRYDDNLLMNLQINLTESLYGFQYPITLLDGRRILIDHPCGKSIRPNSYHCIEGYGMLNRETHSHGNLIIHCDVECPENDFLTSESQHERVEAILLLKSRAEGSNKKLCYEKVQMMPCDPPRTNSGNNPDHSQAEDEDVNLHKHRSGFPCHPQ